MFRNQGLQIKEEVSFTEEIWFCSVKIQSNLNSSLKNIQSTYARLNVSGRSLPRDLAVKNSVQLLRLKFILQRQVEFWNFLIFECLTPHLLLFL